MKKFQLLIGGAALASAAPAFAQTMDHSQHAPAKPEAAAPQDTSCTPEHAKMGHCIPAPVAAEKPPAPELTDPDCPPEHAAMGHCTPRTAPAAKQPAAPADPDCPPEHAAMGHCTPRAPAPVTDDAKPAATGTALPAGNAPAPAAPEPNYADRVWGREAMAPARAAMMSEHGGGTFSQVMLDLAEYQVRNGRDGYHWAGEAWFGGDINRLILKSEGEGAFGEGVESVEVQALYSRAVGPYFNLQAGIRHDIRPGPSRTYATVGFEGLAPYWFELEGALFLSDRGDLLGRIGGYYDQRITQRLILQPRAEINLSAQDMPANGIGAGLSDIELGLRLRYEIAREFAPYVGVSWERKVGATAEFARAHGEDPSSASVVFGVRAWF